MAKDTFEPKIREELENEKKMKNLLIHPVGMWFFGWYVNGRGPTNLVAPL